MIGRVHFARRVFEALGLIGLVIAMVSTSLSYGFGRSFVDRSTELGLSGLSACAVVASGNLYCSLQAFARIQVYSTNGTFEFGFFVDDIEMFEKSFNGLFEVRLVGNSTLLVSTPRNEYWFTLLGERITAEHVGNSSTALKKGSKNTSAVGVNDYTIGSWPNPKVYRDSTSNGASVLVSVPFYRWTATDFVFGWVFMGLAGITAILFRRLMDKEHGNT